MVPTSATGIVRFWMRGDAGRADCAKSMPMKRSIISFHHLLVIYCATEPCRSEGARRLGMREFMKITVALTWTLLLAALPIPLGAQSKQSSPDGRVEETLPKDVYADSRNRLPLIKRDDLDERGKKAYDETASRATPSVRPQGAAAIRLHGSGGNVRRASPVGRQLTELAIIP